MKFPESWLRSFVDPALDTDALAHQLTMSGLEVEQVVPVAPPFSGVVVGLILDAVQHPDADRLRVCRVDVGGPEPLQIVCGAPNARAGIKIPCAQVGAQLPPAEAGGKPFAIKVGKLRGVESYGMLCSAGELKLPTDSDGLLELPSDAPVGANLRDYLQLDDQIFEIKLTPNKADCLSILGVAREVAALTGAPLQLPAARTVAATLADTVPVKVSAPDLCGRFAGRVIRGVNARAQTPPVIKARLERAGLRSVSVLVDLSNYLMLEAGQPTHVFDLDKLDGGLEVRWAKAGETLKLLNGNTVTLDDTVGVVATSTGAVESLAGVMGGDATAVTLDTTNIYIEAAFWWPAAIQGRARKFNFSTDAAHRFERGVDFAQTAQQLEALTALILDVCGGHAGPLDDQVVNLPLRSPVSMRLARAQKILGIPVSRDDVAAIFTRLGLVFDVREQGEVVFVVTPPPFRFDLEIEEDLIEEVARVYGFDHIPARPPIAANVMQPTDEMRRPLHALRHLLAARDYHEVVNYAFVDAQWEADLAGNQHPIALRNPIASQLSVMRSTLFGGLLANVRYNLNRKASRVRAFELGRVFVRDAGMPDGGLTVAGFAQPMLIGGVAWGSALPEQWGAPSRRVDFYDVKGDVEALLAPRTARFVAAAHPALHPGRSAAIEVGGRRIGWIGELHPRWQQQYELPQPAVLFELDAHAITAVGLPQPAPVSRFQPVTRDLALVVAQQVEVQQLFDAFAAQHIAIVQQILLFDEFRPHGDSSALAANEKSLAFRVTLQGADATLQDTDVDAAIAQLVAAAQTVGARLRA